MKFAIFECISTSGGHEIDFDRLIVEELQALGHAVEFYVPQGHVFKCDYHVPVSYLPGIGISYEGMSGIRKLWLAAKREIHRQRWYKALYHLAKEHRFDAIIVPTSTYRYLRALHRSPLKHCPVSLIFVLHGINPGEAARFFHYAEKLRPFSNIKLAVITFGDTIFGRELSNVSCLKPPAYIPRDIPRRQCLHTSRPMRLGFFGQYRKEKQLDTFLDTFLACRFSQPVEILLQGVTIKPEDADDFERIQREYANHSQFHFLHKALLGREWQEAIAGVDALVMPYASERYRYHWGGMLFTAIGFYKPVVVADTLNPEVLAHYDVGIRFPIGDTQGLREALETFVNTFASQHEHYQRELVRANEDFSPRCFLKGLVALV